MRTSFGIVLAVALACSTSGVAEPTRVLIIRHGEKPDDGDQLSCQGMNRALKLPAVIEKLGRPDFAYVPALGQGARTSHARMFQTITPLAVKLNLTVNTSFGETDAAGVAADVRARTGTVLLVWEHSAIADLARQLGVASPPAWKKTDFDSVWIVTYSSGVASLAIQHEGIVPSTECAF
jgi:hypothetical protein